MSRKLPQYVEKNIVGTRTYFYFRRGKGARIRLPDDINSDAFRAAYAAALAGDVEKAKSKSYAEPGTIGALIINYQKSPRYLLRRPSTQTGYNYCLKMLVEKHGHRRLSEMTRARIIAKILQPYAAKPGAYNYTLKLLRVLIKHAIIDLEWLDRDPSFGIERLKMGEIRSITEEEITRFEERWPIGSRERLAFALELYTGQRRSDVMAMTWRDINDDLIFVAQDKTGARLQIPIHAELAAALAATRRENVVILTKERGVGPYSKSGFSDFMRRAFTAAGIPLDGKPHGLRKAAARRLAEVGCSTHEIASITGHKSLKEIERYTREVDQKRLARSAIVKLEFGQSKNKTPKPPCKSLGNASKSKRKTNT